MKPSESTEKMNNDDRTVLRPSPGGRRPHPTVMQTVRSSELSGFSHGMLHDADLQGDNPLLVSAFSLLSLVPKLRRISHHDSVNKLQQQLIEEMKLFENRALSNRVSRNHVDIAKYFLCSLLDETVLNTPWGSQSGWGHNSLSSLFYKKLAGGEEFFQIVDQMKQQHAQHQDLLELAYMCLSLGFEGKYRYMNNGMIALERQRQELYLLIQQLKGEPELELSHHWQGIRDTRNPLTRYVPLWVLAGVTGVLLLIIYMIYAVSIRNQSDRLYSELFSLARSIENTKTTQFAPPIRVKKPVKPAVNRFERLLAPEIAQNKVALIDDRGVRIFNMFPSASASVRNEYMDILAKIAHELQNDNMRLLIVGHTDNQRLKFSTRFKSNWHLSLARAQSTAQVLDRYGLVLDRLRCEGMAGNDPIAPNDTAANRARNRRVDIVIR
jgi:type VI secretion system protein ImpK